MNVYAIWVDLVDGKQDLALANAVHEYLGHFQRQGLVHSFSIERRKFGFGPDNLGEFHIRILTPDLETLDRIFMQAATRDGEVERLHSAVFSRVKNFRSGLYRTFPDEVRKS
ncbi:MAG: hypothetical protein JST12_18710 [Armatimonadetes bacterium]|nr:hypothetical protein [Armatimonadota bacterium]